jgi:ribose 5-phosphate isomerase B
MSDFFETRLKTKINLYIGSDHAGWALKKALIEELSKASKNIADQITISDLGPAQESSVDYPDFADKVCTSIPSEATSQVLDLGVLICGSGQGMAMRANKFPHIRAALCWTPEIAQLSREHNNANILCLGARFVDLKTSFEILKTFLATEFQGGRHSMRVEKLMSPVK